MTLLGTIARSSRRLKPKPAPLRATRIRVQWSDGDAKPRNVAIRCIARKERSLASGDQSADAASPL